MNRPLAHRRSIAVGAWSLVVTGVGHAALVAIDSVTAPPTGEAEARRVMATTDVVGLGLERSLSQLFLGFSVTMALFLVALGMLNLLALRHAPQLFLDTSAVLLLDLTVAVTALAISATLLPPPPIVLFTVTTAAFGAAVALRRTARADRTPTTAPAPVG